MLKHKRIDRICCAAVALAIAFTVLFMNGKTLGIASAQRTMGYEARLFDTSRVHTVDIAMDDWDGFIETCTNEEYSPCAVVIDGEAKKNVGIRAKGNTSLSSVAAYGNDRYSFKIEFDQYQTGNSYYGLDKLSLNNIIQDNTYMKDYLSYTMMREMGVASPLCSFVYITVNGEDWGLYLAVEGVEEAFLQRNYGKGYGQLYKPDSMSMGANRGNGMDFNMDDFMGRMQPSGDSQTGSSQPAMPEGFDPSAFTGQMPEGFDPSGFGGQMPGGEGGSFMPPDGMGGGMGGMGNADVKLQYVDDNPDSYPNIFDNAKTDITASDKARLIQSLKVLSEGEDIESVVDVEAVIRYFVAHNFLCNDDSYTGMMVHNYYLYEQDGVLSMIPWDYNLAFGGFEMGGFGGSAGSGATSTVNSPIDSPVSMGDISARPMIAWIFADETYTQMYHRYYAEFMAQYFDSGRFADMFDATVALISPYVQKDPTSFCTYEQFQKGVDTLRTFCTLRAESIKGQLNGTIPATTAGQSADASHLIDASGIALSDMGSFGGGMGDGSMPAMGAFPQGGDFAGFGLQTGAQEGTNGAPPTIPAESAVPQVTAADDSESVPQSSRAPTENTRDSPTAFDPANMPGDWPTSAQAAQNGAGDGLPLLVASVVVLLAGLAFAFKYKRTI